MLTAMPLAPAQASDARQVTAPNEVVQHVVALDDAAGPAVILETASWRMAATPRFAYVQTSQIDPILYVEFVTPPSTRFRPWARALRSRSPATEM